MIVETFYARWDTIDEIGEGESWKYTYFSDLVSGEKILVAHGRHDGVWPEESRKAIEKYDGRIDRIYCCYPLQMKQATRDHRIQGIHDIRTLRCVHTHKDGETLAVISIVKEGDIN